ncbi:AAA family ATPase [Paraflavisolibacter sp. H34]|uniref:AAA family ATPase n=1 Tax=Huijunlia imazamoxiresistens TaxID=3127457 RepID=UPI003016C99D
MVLLSDYIILERIGLKGSKLFYRAERCRDKQKVILKVYENASARSAEAARIQNEYEIGRGIACKGGARYLALDTYQDRYIAVLEDMEGVLLDQFLREAKPGIGDCLSIALSLTEILEYFYLKGIVHQDLCPSNLLVNGRTLEVKLIDFSHSSPVSALNRTVKEPVFCQDFLTYSAPEQTGRLKGEIDIRSDLYSLGVLLYEMVTGSVPFVAADALSLIHCHIAKQPEPPHRRNPYVPVALSGLILKLLAKNAPDRYQSPFGLKADLLTCLKLWHAGAGTELFPLGQQDFSGRLQQPRRFFGREKEIAALRQSLERVRGSATEVALVGGYSGIGKSALVHQLKETVLQEGGLFIEGKFNQFQRNIPYFAFIQAFKEFTAYILTQGPQKIDLWKERILKAVGRNGRVLTEVLPQLELLIGAQPPLPTLGPNETQNRFSYVFTNFIREISGRDHPLVLFFDDLQWVDAATAHLVKIITTTKGLEGFLFLGAYRDNEIPDHSLFSAIREHLHKEGARLQQLLLAPLPRRNVEEIIEETLDAAIHERPALVDLVFDKSQGNPFFVNAFLKSLFSEEILQFDFTSFQWRWEADRIHRLKVTENIVELMIGRIRKLPAATQELLKLGACLGYQFDLGLLAVVLHQNRQEMAARLQAALDEGLVIPDGDNFRFSHDRIHQAAYSLIAPDKKQGEHLRIGNALLRQLEGERRNTYLFEIVNQLNAGIGSMDRQEDRDQLAALNLSAGIKAKASAAYKPSFDYLQTGISLLPPDAWKGQYGLALELYSEGAESGFLSGHNDITEKWTGVVLEKAADVLDKVRVYEIRIKFYIAQHKLREAVQTALQVLELLQVTFPDKPGKLHVLGALLQVKAALLRQPVATLIDRPLITNPYHNAAIRVMVSVGSAVYFARPDLLPLVILKLFHLMVKYGNSPFSGTICNGYALLLISGLADLEGGYEVGRTAMQLSEKYEVSSLKCQSRMMFYSYVAHLKSPIKSTLEPLYHNFWYGLENGNTEFGSYSAYAYCYSAFFCGRNLKVVTEENDRFNERLQQAGHEAGYNLFRIFAQTVLNLYEPVDHPTVLTGRLHNEVEMMHLYAETETALCTLHLYKLVLCYLFGDYAGALRNAADTSCRLDSLSGNSQVLVFYFYDTLARLAVLGTERNALNRKALLQKVQGNLKAIRKRVRLAPDNCSHKLWLIEAEYFRVMGEAEKAGRYYDKAIDEAIKNEYLNDLALACELAGNFYQDRQRAFLAQHYLTQAHKYYREWGAFNKARQLERRYAYLFDQQQLEQTLTSAEGSEVPSVPLPAHHNLLSLDLHSIMKAATAISSEIQLDKLLKKLVKIGVENAGARKGYLVLKKESGFFIEALGSVEAEEEVVVQSVPLEGNGFLSEAIVQYVYVTKELLVLANATKHPLFAQDPVLTQKGSQSLLCMPIMHQGDVFGILYFENDLITDAFTASHIELLRLLSGQMAISLQNALNEQKKTNAFIEREKLLNQINLHQQELLKTRLEIQEQTYMNISEELHDNIGQVLTLIKLHINTIDTSKPEATQEKLRESKNLLTKVIQDLRDLAKTLHTNFIEKQGLANSIDQQLQFLNRTGLYATQFAVNGEVFKSRPQDELVLFRIVQELLNNAVKHSEATAIDVTIDYLEEKLVITVKDNGKGFDPEKVQSAGKGLGLRNIQNRVSLIKGALSLDTQPQKGTAITIELPRI